MIDEIETVRRSKVRRAKLYFVRRKAAKEIRHQMRRIMAQKDVKEVVIETAPIVEVAKEVPAEVKKEEVKK